MGSPQGPAAPTARDPARFNRKMLEPVIPGRASDADGEGFSGNERVRVYLPSNGRDHDEIETT